MAPVRGTWGKEGEWGQRAKSELSQGVSVERSGKDEHWCTGQTLSSSATTMWKEDSKVKRHAMDLGVEPRLIGTSVCMSPSLCLRRTSREGRGAPAHASPGHPDSTAPLEMCTWLSAHVTGEGKHPKGHCPRQRWALGPVKPKPRPQSWAAARGTAG